MSIKLVAVDIDGTLLNNQKEITPEVFSAVQDAKAAGAKRFNFWGIAYTSDPNHRYAGVTTFKRGFGGQDVSFIPAYDIILSRPKYLKNWIVETTRKKRRKL